MTRKKVTFAALQAKKQAGEKIVMITAYDYPTAIMAEAAEVEMVLVGDSLGNVVLGYETTIPVTVDDIIHHTKPVAKGAPTALVIADMPFGSYQISTEKAIKNAIRFIKEAGADAVKLEGGKEVCPIVRALTNVGIPVVAHIGVLPQTATLWGGYKVQGRDESSAMALVEMAQDLEEAGARAIVLECVATEAAALISHKIDIPTIGIGAGNQCDGQVLVVHDLLGMTVGKTPKFVKKFANLGPVIVDAMSQYVKEVKDGVFPDDEHSFAMEEGEVKKLY